MQKSSYIYTMNLKSANSTKVKTVFSNTNQNSDANVDLNKNSSSIKKVKIRQSEIQFVG